MTPAPAVPVPRTLQWTARAAPCRPLVVCCPGLHYSSAPAHRRCPQPTFFCLHKMCRWTAMCHAELPPLDSRPSPMFVVTSGHHLPWITITVHPATTTTPFCLTI